AYFAAMASALTSSAASAAGGVMRDEAAAAAAKSSAGNMCEERITPISSSAPAEGGVSYVQHRSTTFVVDGAHRLRANQSSTTPTTTSTTPLRVHAGSPSMKLLEGQRTISSP